MKDGEIREEARKMFRAWAFFERTTAGFHEAMRPTTSLSYIDLSMEAVLAVFSSDDAEERGFDPFSMPS